MFRQRIQNFTQIVGGITTVTLAVYGVLAIFGFNGTNLASAEANAATSGAPTVMNYQGTLKDSDGKPLEGEYNMTFRIYGDPEGGTALWSEAHKNVSVVKGDFSVLLGDITPFPADLFSSPDRFIGVTVADYGEMSPRGRIASVPYAINAYNGVPVGTVIDWWTPDTSTPLPEGFVVCDGRTVADPDSPLNGKTLPNLNKRFVRGVTDINDMGASGGINTHTHAIDHNHAAISPDTDQGGLHNHAWARWNDYQWYSYNINGTYGQFTWWSGMEDTGNSDVYPLTTVVSRYFYTENNGAHTHLVSVDLPNFTGSTGSSSNMPSYVQLLKLCRIK